MELVLAAHSTAPMLMHNERLADPLDTIARAMSGISSKRKKTDADHAELAHLEFLGGMYTNTPLEAVGLKVVTNGEFPVVPSWNIIRCLQEAAKRHRRGADVLRGIMPAPGEPFSRLVYDGPSNPQKLWEHGGFSLRKGVGISGKRVMRTRALFEEWALKLTVEVDQLIFDKDTVEVIWREAGRYCGLGDMRPIYGRFDGTVEDASA